MREASRLRTWRVETASGILSPMALPIRITARERLAIELLTSSHIEVSRVRDDEGRRTPFTAKRDSLLERTRSVLKSGMPGKEGETLAAGVTSLDEKTWGYLVAIRGAAAPDVRNAAGQLSAEIGLHLQLRGDVARDMGSPARVDEVTQHFGAVPEGDDLDDLVDTLMEVVDDLATRAGIHGSIDLPELLDALATEDRNSIGVRW